MAKDGTRSREVGGSGDIEMTEDGGRARAGAATGPGKRKRLRGQHPASRSSGGGSSAKRGKNAQETPNSSTGTASSASSKPAEEQRPDDDAPEQGPEPGPLDHVMSVLMQGIRIGEKKLEVSKAQTRAAITRIPPRVGGPGLANVGAVQQARPVWYSPFTETENPNTFFPPFDPLWVVEFESQYNKEAEDGEVISWEDTDLTTRHQKRQAGKLRAQWAAKRLAAATDCINLMVFQVPQLPAELNTSPGGRKLDLLDRLRFWAAKAGVLRRANCKRLRFEVINNKAPFPSIETDLKKEPGGFSRWSNDLLSPGSPPKERPTTSKSWRGQSTTLFGTPNKVLKDLTATDSGVLRVYHGTIPDMKNRPHPWIWFEIRRPVVEDRPSLAEMPPTMHPMPGGMLVFALPQSNQKALSQPGRLHLTLSRGGIPAFEFTHSEGIRDKVAGLPPNFLCVNKYDQSELRNSQQDAMDIYNDNEAKTEGSDSEDDGVWDAWYRWLCRECNKDQQVWNSIFTYMSETRIELIVETMDNEPWMVFEGGEWKEKSVPTARSSTGIGPPPRPLTVSNSRPQRSSSLRNEIKPEDDQGK